MNPITKKYIEGLLSGNTTIIREMYAKLYPKVKRYVIQNDGQEEDALDDFHDGLMYFISQKEKIITIISFEPYFFTVCKNLWKKRLTKRVTKLEVKSLQDRRGDLNTFILEQECYDLYIEKFDLLSANCKEILTLYFNDLSYKDILKDSNYKTTSTIRQRVFKCRTKLISLIKSDKRYQKIRTWKMS